MFFLSIFLIWLSNFNRNLEREEKQKKKDSLQAKIREVDEMPITNERESSDVSERVYLPSLMYCLESPLVRSRKFFILSPAGISMQKSQKVG